MDANNGGLTCNEKLEGEIVFPCFQCPYETQNRHLLAKSIPHKRTFNPSLEKIGSIVSTWLCNQVEIRSVPPAFGSSNWERVQHLHDSRSPPCPHVVPVWSHVFFPHHCTQTPAARTKPVLRNAGSDRVEFQLQGCFNSQDWEPFTWGGRPREPSHKPPPFISVHFVVKNITRRLATLLFTISDPPKKPQGENISSCQKNKLPSIINLCECWRV